MAGNADVQVGDTLTTSGVDGVYLDLRGALSFLASVCVGQHLAELRAALGDTTEDGSSAAAAYELAKLGDSSAIEHSIALLDDPTPGALSVALRALRLMESDPALAKRVASARAPANSAPAPGTRRARGHRAALARRSRARAARAVAARGGPDQRDDRGALARAAGRQHRRGRPALPGRATADRARSAGARSHRRPARDTIRARRAGRAARRRHAVAVRSAATLPIA